ncbi:MAG: alpha/beta hydrolase [Proteobacteria bacterium]|nr:alpha/beta hydrolase [Pseudomonadota bacterium]
MTPRFHEFSALGPHGFTRVAYAEWGPPNAARTVVCVHGLTRNGRDFDPLAAALAAQGMRVVAPDIPGRGFSAWLPQAEDYGYALYLPAMVALIARLAAPSVEWVGTSMGGLIGMMLAAQPGTPIARLVLNDIGAFIPKASLERIAEYAGADPRFADLAAAEAYLQRVHASFGPLTDAEWRHLATYSVAAVPAGGYRLHYDPGIAAAFTAKPLEDIVLWPVWEKVAAPTLIVRGAASDLLLAETAREMTQRGAAAAAGRVRLVEIPGCGHAPALMEAGQITIIRDFLAAT